jgi:hypothetical protein
MSGIVSQEAIALIFGFVGLKRIVPNVLKMRAAEQALAANSPLRGLYL